MKKMRELCRKHAVVCCIAISLLCVALWYYIPWAEMFAFPYASWVSNLIRILFCLLMIKLLGISHTAGFQKSGFGRGLIYGIPFYIIGIGSAIISNWGLELQSLQFISWKTLLFFTISMILVGANEEIWIRGLLLNMLKCRYGNNTKGNGKAILISSLIFGAIHLTNLFYMDPVNLMVQIISSVAAGTLFGAIYIKTENIFTVITLHTLVDWIALLIGDCFTGTNTVLSVPMNPLMLILTLLGGIFIPLISAYFLLRSKNTTSLP